MYHFYVVPKRMLLAFNASFHIYSKNSSIFAAHLLLCSSVPPETSTKPFSFSSEVPNISAPNTPRTLILYSNGSFNDSVFQINIPYSRSYLLIRYTDLINAYYTATFRKNTPHFVTTSRKSAENIFMVLTLKASTNLQTLWAVELLCTLTSAANAL